MEIVTALEASGKRHRFILWAPNPGLKVGDAIEVKVSALGVVMCGKLLMIEIDEATYNETKNGTDSLPAV